MNESEPTEELKAPVIGLQCGVCLDHIYSSHRHDWQDCSCGGLFVDGGRDYLRCGGTSYSEASRVLIDPSTDRVVCRLAPDENPIEEDFSEEA